MSKQGVILGISGGTLNWETPLLNHDRGVACFVIILCCAVKVSAVVNHLIFGTCSQTQKLLYFL